MYPRSPATKSYISKAFVSIFWSLPAIPWPPPLGDLESTNAMAEAFASVVPGHEYSTSKNLLSHRDSRTTRNQAQVPRWVYNYNYVILYIYTYIHNIYIHIIYICIILSVFHQKVFLLNTSWSSWIGDCGVPKSLHFLRLAHSKSQFAAQSCRIGMTGGQRHHGSISHGTQGRKTWLATARRCPLERSGHKQRVHWDLAVGKNSLWVQCRVCTASLSEMVAKCSKQTLSSPQSTSQRCGQLWVFCVDSCSYSTGTKCEHLRSLTSSPSRWCRENLWPPNSPAETRGDNPWPSRLSYQLSLTWTLPHPSRVSQPRLSMQEEQKHQVQSRSLVFAHIQKLCIHFRLSNRADCQHLSAKSYRTCRCWIPHPCLVWCLLGFLSLESFSKTSLTESRASSRWWLQERCWHVNWVSGHS